MLRIRFNGTSVAKIAVTKAHPDGKDINIAWQPLVKNFAIN
ncbi:MAG: hypothetical protein ACTXOO_01040 [Sodalis sp. (in: enterobacteria)]